MDSKYSLDDISVAPVQETPVRSDVEIITTPLVEQSWQLFENCRITQAMGVIQGPSGTGKPLIVSSLGPANGTCWKEGYFASQHIL